MNVLQIRRIVCDLLFVFERMARIRMRAWCVVRL